MRTKIYDIKLGVGVIFFFMLSSLLWGIAFAQQETVRGIVTDASTGSSLPSVNILVKGTSIGVATKADGTYELQVSSLKDTLVFSFIGYQTQTVPINGRHELDVALQPKALNIKELVVVGYGTQKKQSVTGAVASVGGDELRKRPVSSVGSMLQGQVPGLSIVQNSGIPGNQGISIRIRGQGTYSGAGSDPLVLIDGVKGSLSDISPHAIKNITVLKDAASAAIYGAQAANGVILVTTKKGTGKGFNVTYDANFGIHTPSRMLDLITNSATYMKLFNEAKLNSGINTGLYPQSVIDKYKNVTNRKYPNADWVDIVFNPAFVMEHHISVSGSEGSTNYNVAFSYLNQEGVMMGFDYKRYNLRLNLGSQVSESVEIGANLGLKKGNRSAPRQGASDTFLSTLSQAPTYLPQLPDGRYVDRAYAWEATNKNVVALVENNVLQTTTDYSVNAQLFADIQLLPSLVWYTKAAITGDFTHFEDWRPQVPLYNYRTGDLMRTLDVGGSGLTEYNGQNIYTNIYSYFKFEKDLTSNHHLMAQLGYSQEENVSHYLQGYRKSFVSNNLTELNAGSPSLQRASGSRSEWALRSFFGRLKYNYQERYIVGVTARYDGSSRLYKERRWGFFPSVSLAWRVTEEPLIENADINWLNNLKIRASYGELGNQKIGIYPYQSLLSLTGYYSFDNSNLSTGVAQTALSNKRIQWETTTILDIGVDLTAFEGLNVVFDWYRKKTSNILRRAQITDLVGLSAPYVNSGVMLNTGVELAIQYQDRIQSGLFSGLFYNIGFNINHNRNELVQFGAREIHGRYVLEEGRPWQTFYMLKTSGIFQTKEQIAKAPKQFNDNTLPGDLIYKDVNGDGVINSDDRTYVDGRYPDFEYAFNVSARWNNFDLAVLFQGVQGRKIFVQWWGVVPFTQGAPPRKMWLNRWTQQNHSTTVPRIYFGFQSPAKFTRTSTYFLKDASYLRLKNVTLGYTLPVELTNQLNLERLRFYVSGDNLITWTDYPGLDPERTGGGRFVHYPQNTIYSIGINVKF